MSTTEQIETVEIVNRFKKFLWNFVDRRTRSFKYRERLSQMAIMGRRSLVIDFSDITLFDRALAHFIEEQPDIAIEAASMAIKEIIEKENPDYAATVEKFYPRFRNLSRIIPIRELTSEYIGKMVAIEGILTRLTKVSAKLVKARYQHLDPECMAEFDYPEFGEIGERIEKPSICPICGKGGKFNLLLHKSKFIDWQKIVVQEKPEEIPPGQIPRSIEVVLTGDLVDTARPGDRVVITGVLRVMPTSAAQKASGKAVFSFYIDANYIDVQQKVLEEIEITREDEEAIKEMSRDPWIREKIIASIAPAIYGHWDIKEAIALQLFGGVPKPLPDGTRIRGDIHVLLVGDPGTAKSQILQYTARIAPRGIYTSGKGSTAAGLTASVLRDKSTGEYYLEAGALVIADGGLAAIDEIDKMREEDRSAIHEALEQQSYHHDYPIMLADGRYVKIGDLVDEYFDQHKDKIIYARNTQLLYNPDIWLIGFDPYRMEPVTIRVDRISRHKAPRKYVVIRISNGREIKVTPEHPIIVLSENGIQSVPAITVKPGDLVLGINRLPIPITRKYIEELRRRIIGKIRYDENEKLYISIESRNEANEIQDKLLALGIPIFVVHHKDEYRLYPSGPVSLVRLSRILGSDVPVITSSDLIIELPETISTLYEVEYYLQEHNVYPNISVHKSNNIVLYSKNMLIQKLSRLEEKLGRNTTIHMVVDIDIIEDERYEWVYDLTVEPFHLFISHGLVLHNTISIAKAGIVARLNARTSVLAAGNPKYGRYDPMQTIGQNIDLPPPILSRFDLIFVIRDIPHEERDKLLAKHVLSVHMDIEKAKPIIDITLLKKYISYARRYIKPRLTQEAKELLEQFYISMRKASISPDGKPGPIAITPRQLEALIRLSEAHAKMALKTKAGREDAEEAIRLMFTTLKSVGIDVETGRPDIDALLVGETRSRQERIKRFMQFIDQLFEEYDEIEYNELVKLAGEKGFEKSFVSEMIRRLKRDGVIYEPTPRKYRRIT